MSGDSNQQPAADADYILRPFFGELRQEMVSHVPHATDLGLIVEHVGPCETILRVPMRDHLLGDPVRRVVFGGVITTLLDQAGGIAVMASLKALISIATIDLRIDYMKPAPPDRDLLGRALCYRQTRNVAFVRGEAYTDDPGDPFAIFLSTYMLAANPMPPGVMQQMEERFGDGK
jgi:uncharacterized protein (TIGR00369 family)